MKSRLLIIAVALLTLALGACSTSRKSEGISYDNTPGSASPLSQKELQSALSKLESSYKDWKTVKTSVNLNMSKPAKAGLSGVLTMERDRYVHLSIRFLGMEVASVMATTDSIYATYKLDRLYLAESLEDLTSGMPVTVGNLQDLILGHVFSPGGGRIDSSRFKIEGNSALLTLSPKDLPANIDCNFIINTPGNFLQGIIVNIPKKNPVTADYSDFISTPAGHCAKSVELSASTSQTKVQALVSLSLNKAEWGKAQNKTWSQPKGYKRVKAEDILKMLSAF